MNYAILLLIALLLVIGLATIKPCENTVEAQKVGDVYVMEVEGHDYIFWEHGRGSDFEHHAGCTNH